MFVRSRAPLMAAFASVAVLISSSAYAQMSDADCQAAWNQSAGETATTLPADKGSRYYAALRVANKTVEDGKLTKADFMTHCKAGLFATSAEAGAPLKGANSFTENQARDRAVSHGFTGVSALTKDEDGIWRGTAQKNGKPVKIAIDFKGNVVGN